ncbi:MAG: DUF4338 domain-containing protein [Bryobacterales bacterium]|nr:DUF4338 domain-containing protein [Bryobacterales bacterium]
MDPRIKNLKSTTFFGRRFTRRQIAGIQQTVATFPALSRKELAQTICEHLRWRTPTGGNRVTAALRLLEQLERAGILTLPAKRTHNSRPGPRRPVALTARTAPQPLLEAPLRELLPLRLQLAAPDETGLWNEFIQFIQRHHYLGYKQPLGPHLRYFLRDCQGRRLGCLLFSQATRSLPCRDAWVGWPQGSYKKHLDLVVGQPRFLLFPWVRVKNLASHALALAARQLPADWQRRWGRRPVLLETFVDPQRFRGTCYRAANWQLAGRTPGRADAGRSPKDVYLYPLARHCREILWQGLIGALSTLAADHDWSYYVFVDSVEDRRE